MTSSSGNVPVPGQAYLSVTSSPHADKVGNINNANTETFEIEDFTATSEWEKFEAKLQHILREWAKDKPRENNKRSNKNGPKSGWIQVCARR